MVDPTSPGEWELDEDSRVSEDAVAEAVQTILNTWRDRIVRSRVPAFASVRIGRRVDEILARAEGLKADLVVMTTHGNCRPHRPFHPSTAEKVMCGAPCPALIIPARRVRDFEPDYDGFPSSSWKTLLMPVDFSARSGRVLKYAAALSIENRAKLVLLNIMLEGAGTTNGPGLNPEENCRRLERRGKRRLKEWVKGQMVLPLEFESVIWAGIPSAYAVPLEAKLSKADLIVMPVRKACNSGHTVRRSIKDIILRSATCPILSIQEQMP